MIMDAKQCNKIYNYVFIICVHVEDEERITWKTRRAQKFKCAPWLTLRYGQERGKGVRSSIFEFWCTAADGGSVTEEEAMESRCSPYHVCCVNQQFPNPFCFDRGGTLRK
jgi:hypothetical protein